MNSPVRYIRLHSGDVPAPLDSLPPFKAIILIEEAVSEIWRWDLCRWLVASGCRYAMIWGPECESWVETIDEASLEAANYEDIPMESLIQVTSHEEEEVTDVFWFARHKATHPVQDLRDTVIVHLSASDRQRELEALLASA